MIDSGVDSYLHSLGNYLADAVVGLSIESQIKLISVAVVELMGGPIAAEKLSDHNFKFKISETKIKLGSNVIPIGQVTQGTFYHRALLFKALCDRVGLKPCTLVRGEYNRAWNVVDIKVASVGSPKLAAPKRAPTATRPKSTQEKPPPTPPTLTVAEQKSLYTGDADLEAASYGEDDAALIDLMFVPGRLMSIQSADAVSYQRQFS